MRFTVIIPLFNKENFITRAVNSVLSQEYQDFELIIVNDGSTDNSLSVASRINDSRIKIKNKTNGGVSSSRNAGVEFAVYDWICFLDADDYWLPNHLSEIFHLINNYQGAAAYTTIIGTKDLNGIKRIETLLPFNFEGYLTDYFFFAYKQAIFHSSSSCISKKALIDLGCFNIGLKHGEDLDLWYRLMLNYQGVAKDITTAVYDLTTENRAMHLNCSYDNHILSKVTSYRNTNVRFLNKYIDYFILRNSVPFFFSIEKSKVSNQLREIIDGGRSQFIWKIVYSEYLFLINQFIYRIYKKLKNNN